MDSMIFWVFQRNLQLSDLKIHLDTRSVIYQETDLLPLGAATTMSFDGTWRLAKNYVLDVVITKDVGVGTTPDVVFQINIMRNTRL